MMDGTVVELASVVSENDVDRYLMHMRSVGVFGDHITLLGMACLFKVKFVILSSLGAAGTRIISPTVNSDIAPDLPVLLLGHFAEGHPVIGEHYVSLDVENDDIKQDTLSLKAIASTGITCDCYYQQIR